MNRECKTNSKNGLVPKEEIMALKETIHKMRQQITEITHDLEKALEGNKAAAQRVRTSSIRFSKTAKIFRKESVAAMKSGQKKAAKKPPAKKKAPVKKKKK